MVDWGIGIVILQTISEREGLSVTINPMSWFVWRRAWAAAFALCTVGLLAFNPARAQETEAQRAKAPSIRQPLWVADLNAFNRFIPGALTKSGTPNPNLKFGIEDFSPGAVTTDSAGNLWGCGNLSTFTAARLFRLTSADIRKLVSRHKVAPSVDISSEGQWGSPHDLKVDSSGNVWSLVAEPSNARDEIVEYKKEQFGTSVTDPPAVIIEPTGASLLGGMQFDKSGNLWLEGVLAGLGEVVMAFTPSQLVSSGSVAPALVLTTSNTAFRPGALLFDGDGNLWVSNNPLVGPAQLLFFPAASLTGTGMVTVDPTVTIALEFSPGSLAMDANGNLWVTSVDNISEFAADQIAQSGRPTPVVVLRENKKRKNFDWPHSIAFGPAN